jgi:hypothetical protein
MQAAVLLAIISTVMLVQEVRLMHEDILKVQFVQEVA